MNTEQPQPWAPPNWARLLVYLAGAALFVIQPLAYPPPNFWLLAMDAIVLIGLSPEVFKQFASLLLGLAGRTPPSSPPTPEPPKAPTDTPTPD